jgi:hypothetical protein
MDDRLADRTAIQELKASYFRLLDTKEWESWRALFTDDCCFYYDDGPVPMSTEPVESSGDDFVEMVSRALKGAVTVHQGHMPEIQFLDDRNAQGIWAMYDWVDSSGSGGTSMQGFGHYHEHYVKGDDGRWRISRLRLTRLRTDTAETGAVPRLDAPWTRPAGS